ncbi:hypothetical protein FSARC_2352 [Fusarium sarcochroum]|uniref:Uncharacterized protein n=1 Tax=Fusarium sarcochroum TaxID=1208366 RepID=A0A8H4U6M2_9HYPO|nr:hypothetical protein FSARC_2352 [Fusarium sarcochroum]
MPAFTPINPQGNQRASNTNDPQASEVEAVETIDEWEPCPSEYYKDIAKYNSFISYWDARARYLQDSRERSREKALWNHLATRFDKKKKAQYIYGAAITLSNESNSESAGTDAEIFKVVSDEETEAEEEAEDGQGGMA